MLQLVAHPVNSFTVTYIDTKLLSESLEEKLTQETIRFLRFQSLGQEQIRRD